jgi:acyl carrier protein
VRQLADHHEGTELRSIALLTESGPRRALSGAASAALVNQLGFERAAGLIESGWFLRLGPPGVKGPIELLRPPPAPSAAPSATTSPHVGQAAPSPGGAPAHNDRLGEKLAQTFRSAFGLPPGADVSNLAIGSVKRWDSLGHLKLMMEVEQALRVRLPAEALARIQSYRDLEKAVRAYMPAT